MVSFFDDKREKKYGFYRRLNRKIYLLPVTNFYRLQGNVVYRTTMAKVGGHQFSLGIEKNDWGFLHNIKI